MNVKFVIEGMEETSSNGLDTMILAQGDTFFSNVDCIVINEKVISGMVRLPGVEVEKSMILSS